MAYVACNVRAGMCDMSHFLVCFVWHVVWVTWVVGLVCEIWLEVSVMVCVMWDVGLECGVLAWCVCDGVCNMGCVLGAICVTHHVYDDACDTASDAM